MNNYYLTEKRWFEVGKEYLGLKVGDVVQIEAMSIPSKGSLRLVKFTGISGVHDLNDISPIAIPDPKEER